MSSLKFAGKDNAVCPPESFFSCSFLILSTGSMFLSEAGLMEKDL